MKILGIDPGLAILGWSVLDVSGGRPRRVHYGSIRTAAGLSLTRRLLQVHADLTRIVAEHRPAVVALETLFFAKNVKTLAQVGHTRGVILLVAGQAGLEVFEYAPRQVKSALTGFGGADKKQMQETVRRTLGLPSLPTPDDAADAVAVALCHSQFASFGRRLAATA